MPRPPRRLLDELAARGQRAAASGKDRPAVTLHLATGRDLTGRVVALGDEGGVAMVGLHVGGPVAAPTVAHVRVDQIVAVTVDLAPDRPAAADAAAPGRLELARALAAQAAQLAGRLGHALAVVLDDPLGDDDRRAVGAALPIVERVLTRLADDAMGKAALAALTELRVGAAAHGAARRAGTVVTLELPRGGDDAWDDVALRRELEKAL